MEQVVMGLAMQYAKSRGLNMITDKALEYAYETLGIESEEDDYINKGGIYGIKNAFTPKNLMKSLGRNVLTGAAKKAISGKLSLGGLGFLGPLGLIAGIAFLGNKYRKQLTGYNTQAEYERARETRNANNRLSKITDRIVSGKKYGNYKTAIMNSGAGGVQATNDGPISHAHEGVFTQKEYDDFNKTPVNKNYGNNDNDNSGDHDGGASADAQSDDAAGAGGYNKGGIAGINRNRGQLGETLYG